MRQRTNKQQSEKGASLLELVILTPVLLVMIMGATDLSRMVFSQQALIDLTRESANLVSRGASEPEAFAAAALASDGLDVSGDGAILISRVRRRAIDDPTPWVITQRSNKTGPQSWGKIGTVNGPATIPNVEELAIGVTITAVEIVVPFDPLFVSSTYGLNFYPDQLYDSAFF